MADLAYGSMNTPESMRIPLPPELFAKWRSLLQQKKISQQMAVVALIEWFMNQDDLFQSIILGQLNSDGQADVAELILQRMAGRSKGKGSIRKAV